jgi:tetratricopeptide (TPR) repeat protein
VGGREALKEFKEANAESANECEIVYLFMIGESYFQLAKYNEAIEKYKETEKAVGEYELVRTRINRYIKESKDLADVIEYTLNVEELIEKKVN